MRRKPALGVSPLDELAMPDTSDAISSDGIADGKVAVAGQARPPRHRGPNTPHKLTTYLPEHAYRWARDQAYAASSSGGSTSIADVLRLALVRLELEGDEAVQNALTRG
jgi:hypothetical protein